MAGNCSEEKLLFHGILKTFRTHLSSLRNLELASWHAPKSLVVGKAIIYSIMYNLAKHLLALVSYCYVMSTHCQWCLQISIYFINKHHIPGLCVSWLKQLGSSGQFEAVVPWTPLCSLLCLLSAFTFLETLLNDTQKHALKIHVQFSHVVH